MTQDPRTDQQRAADERLDNAIREVVAAYWGGGYVTEFAVVAHQLLADDEGEQEKVLLVLPDGGRSMPVYRVLGLTTAGRLLATEMFSDGDPLGP